MSDLLNLDGLTLPELIQKENEVYNLYQKIITLKQLSEKDLLSSQINELQQEIDFLNSKINNYNLQIIKLEEQINNL